MYNSSRPWPRRLVVRILGFHPRDRGFESRRGHQKKKSAENADFSFLMTSGHKLNPLGSGIS